jgi:hypothetical protein
MSVRILQGDCRDVLRALPDESVHCVVTSPPYFGLRDYGVAGQIGLEATPDGFVAELVAVFREVRRVLRADGTLWLNLGDSYAGGGGHSPNAPSSAYSKSGKYGMALEEGGIKPQGAAWIEEAGWEIKRQLVPSFSGPVSLAYELSTKSRMDLCNCEKGVTDLLVAMRIIPDDSPKYVRGVVLNWSSEVEGVRVTVSEV